MTNIEKLNRPRPVGRLVAVALMVAVLAVLSTISVANLVNSSLDHLGMNNIGWSILLWLSILLSAGLFYPWSKSLRAYRLSQQALHIDNIVDARINISVAREYSWITLGWSCFVFITVAFIAFIFMNDMAVGRTFFLLPLMQAKWWLVTWKFFSVNVFVFAIAEVLVLIWGLIVAMARLAPGRAGLPIRTLAILYCDVFRGLPGIVTLYLIGFGIPTSGIPDMVLPHIYGMFVDTSAMTLNQIKDATRIPVWGWCILALTLTYGAYVAEVYRSGIESIHWSQVSAARSLGLSHLQTMRYVIVPQAVRRIMAPLLNDFIGLQKDTALVQVVGLIDGFSQAKIIAANAFNLSAVTVVAILFVAITIPQARLVDYIMERDAARIRSGG